MKKTILAISILVSLILLGGVVWAMQLSRTGALRWDDSAWSRAYIEIGLTEPITGTFVFSGMVRLVDEDGGVLNSQPIEAPGCVGQEDPGSGQCGTAFSWSWETDDYPRKTITEQIKLTWIAPDHDSDIEIVLPWVPIDCDLSNADCTILFFQNTWRIDIPQSCRDALAACDTYEDLGGWWFVSTFEGTEPWTHCLPGIAVGGPQ